MVQELLKKYIWLVQTLIRAGDRGLTLEELDRRWESRFGTGYARRTFNNHREAVEELFDIRIRCNRSTSRYFISGAAGMEDSDASAAWLINTFTVNEMLSLSRERLSGRVSVEDIPSGQRYLTAIIGAMTENSELKIAYRKYTSDEVSEYALQPYAVKESARRWYLVAWCHEREAVRVYGLDRIVNLEHTGRQFRMPQDFDVDALFATNFGVYLSSERPVEIVFKASVKEAGYLRDLPIHPSQKETGNDGERITFSIFVRPNESLLMELFRLGSRIEVVSPDPIREKLMSEASALSELYGNRMPD